MPQVENCIGDGQQSGSFVVALISHNQYICYKGDRERRRIRSWQGEERRPLELNLGLQGPAGKSCSSKG